MQTKVFGYTIGNLTYNNVSFGSISDSSLVSVSSQYLINDKLTIKHYRIIGHREVKDCVDNLH